MSAHPHDDGNQSFFHSEPHTSGVDTGRKRKPPKNLADGMVKALSLIHI